MYSPFVRRACTMFVMYFGILLLITTAGLLASTLAIQRRQINSNLVTVDYPRFLVEPTAERHYFSNSTGVTLNCQANPPSMVYWILASDLSKTVSDSIKNQDLKQFRLISITGLRHLLSNGSIHFPPFTASSLNPTIHSTAYKCVASNPAGTIVSRTVHVAAVIDQRYDVAVYDEFAISGNTAVLKCQVPSQIKQFIRTEAWIRDSSLEITSTTDKYSFFRTGELHVKQVTNADSFSKFRCRVKNVLTNETRMSTNSASIVISTPTNTIAPRVLHSVTSLEIDEQNSRYVELPCAAESWPLPSYRWYKLTGLEDEPLSSSLNSPLNINKRQLLGIYSVNQTNSKLNNQAEIGSSGSLILRNLRPTDAAHYVCIAFNSLGEFTVDSELKIRRALSTSIRPKRLISDKRTRIVVNCTVSGSPIDAIHWYHNGMPLSVLDEKVRIMLLGDQSVLMLDELSENACGLYQCIAENELFDSAQDSIELLLGEIKPILSEKFSTDMRAQLGDDVTLKCVASGSPLPMITWWLDNEQIIEERNDGLGYGLKSNSHNNRYLTDVRDAPSRLLWGDYVLFGKNQVVSHLNFTVQSVLNAGRYSCIATNSHGSITHQGRLEVNGETRIKPMRSRSVVAQQLSTMLDCIIVGSTPISFHWLKDGLQVPFNHRQRIHKNASLEILNIDKKTDSGNYTCVAAINTTAGHVQSISESMLLTVKVSPVIEDFKFDNKLQAGMRTRIYCNVAQGDQPLQIRWLKNGKLIESNDQITNIRTIDQFSLALVIENLSAIHNANYTCQVSNDAIAPNVVSHTAELLVNIPPQWQIEPNSTYSAIEGSSVMFDCVVANGYPPAQVVWKQLKNKVGPTAGNLLNKNFLIDTVSAYVDSNVISGNPSLGQATQQYQLIRSGPHYQVFENGSLRISEVNSLLDATNYLCQASNGIGPGLSKMTTLKVNVPAKFEENKFDNISALKGQPLSLKCEAYGDLPITFQWFKQGEQIRPNERPLDERYQLEQISDSSVNRLTAFLNISSLVRSDSVRFECRARNQFGGDVRYIDLIVREPPEAPIKLQLESASSRSLFIKWQTPFTGNSPITQYNILVSPIGSASNEAGRALESTDFDYKATNNEQQPATNQESNRFFSIINQLISTSPSGASKNAKSANLDPTLTDTHNHYRTIDSIDYLNNKLNFTVLANLNSYVIRGLNPANNYSIQMEAINTIGSSDLSAPLFACTEEESPSEPPKNIKVTVLNATSVLVTFDSPDLQHRNGLLKGFYVGYKTKDSTSHYTYKTLQIDKTADELLEQHLTGIGVNSLAYSNRNQHQLILNRLKPYTDYSLIIQAYNGIGAGPRSDEIRFKTDQSAPSAAPSITKCTSPNSRTLHLSWTKLNTEKLNGELAGYKVHYYTFDEQVRLDENQIIVDGNQNLINNILQPQQTSIADNELNSNQNQLINLNSMMIDRLPVRRTEHIPADQNETQLSNLNKFTNYTISIQAFTSAGDGPLSEFIFCSTMEDIPEAPQAIKVVQTSSDSFYITWISPRKTNGQLKSYTIYRKQIDQTEEDELNEKENISKGRPITTHPNNLYTFTVPKHVNYHRTSQLNSGSSFEFYVTATNSIGESEPSARLHRTLNKNGCPAEIINFNTIYNVCVGESVEMSCKSAGQPQVTVEWLFNGSSLRSQAQSRSNMNIHEHYSPNEQIFSSFLHLTNIQSTDQGNYTCHSFNIHGHSYATYQLQARDLDTLDRIEYDDELEDDKALGGNNQLANQQVSNSTFSTITSPLIRLIKSNYDHIIIQWKVRNPMLLNSILAYEIFYRPVSSLNVATANVIDTNAEWKQFRLRNTLLDEQTTTPFNLASNRQQSKAKLKRNKQITINGLNCGTNYQIYMILDTVFGKSTPSNVLNSRTLGREPIAANVGVFFSRLNSTTVKLNLDKWSDGGCSVLATFVKWKQLSISRNNTPQIAKKSSAYSLLNGGKMNENQLSTPNSQWNPINNIWHTQQPVYLTNLDQNNHYKVRVDMRNAAGLTSMDYDLRVNAVAYVKTQQSENTFRVLSSSSSYSNHDLDSSQDGGNKNVDLIRSSTIGSTNGEDGQQMTSQIIFLSLFVVLLFVIVIAVFAFFHRSMQQKLFYARSNRMLQMASDANSILSGPTNGSAINASDSVSCVGLGKQHLNKLHQLNMDYSNTCPTNLTAELSVLRSNQQQYLDPTYTKCLLKQQPSTNTIPNTLMSGGQQHTTSLHNIESDNVYQSLTLARTNTDNLLSTFSKKIGQQPATQNPQEIYSVIQKNRQNAIDQHTKTIKQSTFSKPYEIVDELEQRYSIPKINNLNSLNLTNQLHGNGSQQQITEHDIQKLEQYQQRMFESNGYVTTDDALQVNQFNHMSDDTLVKQTINTSLPKMFNNFETIQNGQPHNDCNCCLKQPIENDCCTMNSKAHHWRTNCDFSY